MVYILRRIAPLMAAKKRVLRGAALEKEGGRSQHAAFYVLID